MNAAFHKKLKGSAMLWCIIIMSILALVVLVSVSVAAAYERSVARSVCMNQLEYDAESALRVACSRICTGNGEPNIPILRTGESEVLFDNGTAMGTVSLKWDEDENILTATASVPDYGECSVSAVLDKKEIFSLNSVNFPEIDEEGKEVIYESTLDFKSDQYYYTFDKDLQINHLEDGGVYFFKGEYGSDVELTFDDAGNSYVIADIYILLEHSQKLTIKNIPPNVRLFIFPAFEDINNEAEVTINASHPVKGSINCGTLITKTEVLSEAPDETIVSFTRGYSYELVRYKN